MEHIKDGKFLTNGLIGAIILLLGSAMAHAEPVIMLIYQEIEQNYTKVLVRKIINAEFMRIDNGKENDGFVLYDRKKQIIYNVSFGDKSIFTINAKKSPVKAPLKFSVREKTVTAETTALLHGKLKHLRFWAGDQLCLNRFILAGLLPEAIKAQKEFLEVLAGEHLAVIKNTPQEMQEPCDFALHISHWQQRFEGGYPVLEYEYTGKERILMDFDPTYQLTLPWTQLPLGFKLYSPEKLRSENLDV